MLLRAKHITPEVKNTICRQRTVGTLLKQGNDGTKHIEIQQPTGVRTMWDELVHGVP